MPQYWLKPLGFTRPEPRPIDDDWSKERGLEDFELAKVQNPPQMGRGDRVLLHAVITAKHSQSARYSEIQSGRPTENGGRVGHGYTPSASTPGCPS